MIVKMKKLNLVGMAYEKDAVLNALQRTGDVEGKLHRGEEHSAPLPPAGGTLLKKHQFSTLPDKGSTCEKSMSCA